MAKSAHGGVLWVVQREFRVARATAAGGGGKAVIATAPPPHQDLCSLFMAKMWSFIRRFSASQTSEHFLPQIKDVAFCF